MSHDPALDDFAGTVRLFPLPNMVMFPRVVQPLHIFEPRYRALLADALAGDRLIAMALLRPDWEEDYHMRPPMHPVVCVGRVYQEERLADGRYNLLLRGLQRARIQKELTTDLLYRTAEVTLLHDEPVADPEVERTLREALTGVMGRLFAGQPATLAQLQRLQQGDLSLGNLADVFTFALPLDPEIKQRLLEETDVALRSRLLLDELAACDPEEEEPPAPPRPAPAPGRPFPPGFSQN